MNYQTAWLEQHLRLWNIDTASVTPIAKELSINAVRFEVRTITTYTKYTWITNDTTWTTTTVSAIRAGSEAEYNALWSHSASVIYHIY